MLKNGVQKTNYHAKDYSFERTFGAVSPIKLPDEYNADLGLSFPNQNKDGYPNGCTGYTTSELGQDENGVAFDPAYTYQATLAIDNLPPGSPCKIRTSLGSAKTYGLKRTDGQPNLHRGSYFDVDKVGDYFDGIRSALYKNQAHKRSISAASPWFSEWLFPKNGILKAPKRYVWDSKTIGHNYKICGWKTIQGEPYLILKPWSGPGYGDGGYAYMSREICNKTFNISGCALYIQTNMVPGEIERVKLDILELILAFYRRLQKLVALPESPKPMEPEVSPIKTKKEELYNVAYAALGTDMAPLNDTLGCAEALSHVLMRAGVPLSQPVVSSYALDKWFQKNLKEVLDPEPGDIISSPTGTGNGKVRGHVGIVGKNSIMSNNSQSGKWDYHWTLAEWKKYYETYGGIKTRFYRWV